MKKNCVKKGFSLPEVIIAVTMISLVIVTATNLLVSSIRANNDNIKRMIAYNLAQEGLEGFRNIRDNYWIQNLNWLGEDDKNFSEVIENDGYYLIRKTKQTTKAECQDSDNDFNLSGNFESVKRESTWSLKEIPGTKSELFNNSRLYILEENGLKRYEHNSIGVESGFSRWIEVQKIPTPYDQGDEINKVAVVSVVQWQDAGNIKEVRIPQIFTNWKEGPL